MMSTHSSSKETNINPSEAQLRPDVGPAGDLKDLKDPADPAAAQVWNTIVLVFRNHLVLTVSTLILLMAALPVILLMLPVKYYDSTTIEELFRYLVGIPVSIISTVALILSAGKTFSFLHQKTAVDVYHALPVRRSAFFVGRFLGGALLVLLPQLLTFVTVLLIRFLPGYQILEGALVIKTALSFMLMSLALYAVSVLSFVLSGKLFDAMFLLLMFNIAYPGVLYAIDSVVERILPGFAMTNSVNIAHIDRYLLLSPIGGLLKTAFQPLSAFNVLWWLALILAMSIGSLLIYQRRPSELASRALAYKFPFLMIRFLACLAAGLIFGYLYYDLYATLLAFIFSAAVGSLITHTLIEAVLSRSFRNYRRSLKSYGVFILVFAMGCLIVATGLFGYDTRLPAKDRIVQARLALKTDYFFFFANSSDSELVFSDPENLARLREMNQAWLNEMQTQAARPYTLNTNSLLGQYASDAGYSAYRITYVLPSGWKFVRTVYFNFSEEPYASLYRQIRASEEYKRQQYKYLFQADSELKAIILTSKTGLNIPIPIERTDQERLAKILAALQQDLLENAEGQPDSKLLCYLDAIVSFGYEGPIGNQGFTQTTQHIALTDAYVNTVALFEEYGFLSDLDADINQFVTAYITSSDSEDKKLSLLERALRYSQGPYCYPVNANSQRDGDWPLLNDEEIFTQVEDPDLVRYLYMSGQDVANAENGGYFVVLAAAGQVGADGINNTSLPILYLPADQVPEELANLLNQP